jgi:hypothetical protein
MKFHLSEGSEVPSFGGDLGEVANSINTCRQMRGNEGMSHFVSKMLLKIFNGGLLRNCYRKHY